MLMPKKVKYRKQQRGRMTGKAWRGSSLAFGEFGLKAMECGWITDRQIEAARIAMTRFIKRGGKVWIRLFPDKPITKKPAETRMGKGKGAPEAVGGGGPAGQDPVRDGRRGPRDVATEAMRLAAHKLAITTKFVAPRIRRGVTDMKAQKVRDLDEHELTRPAAAKWTSSCSVSSFQMRWGRPTALKKYREHAEGPCADVDDPARAGTGGEGEEVRPIGRKARASRPASERHKNEKVGEVVSTKMEKTIVVEVSRRVPHPLYKRIVTKRKKFYAHDEESTAQAGRRGAHHRMPAAEQVEALAAGRSRPPRGAGGRAARADLDVKAEAGTGARGKAKKSGEQTPRLKRTRD